MPGHAPGAARGPAVLLLGPTASGKSALALALARRFDLEIVSVDSALVYRGLDIGTAKPTPDERRAVAHHLIDIVEPTASYSAAAFAADARRLIDEIGARGRLALLVGGTMLYARALLDGLDALPPADAAVRARIDDDARRIGWPALHRRLRELDPITAARLEPADAQRIQRALEVHALTGRPLSALHGHRSGVPHEALQVVSLEPSNRAELHARIARRFDAMLSAGFVQEVESLRARGDLHPGLPAMRCVGYRQVWAWLDRPAAPNAASSAASRAASRGAMIEQALAATRQLAKRQLTWLRAMPQRHAVDCLAPDALEGVSAIIDRLPAGGRYVKRETRE